MKEIVYLIELNTYDPLLGAETTHYYSDSQDFTAFPGTDPDRPNQEYDSRLKQPSNFEVNMFARGATRGLGESRIGEIEINNTEGELDALLNHGFDGRRLTVYRGAQDAAFADFEVWLRGTMESVEFTYNNKSGATLRIKVRSRAYLFDRLLQQTRYLGTNTSGSGKEGTAEDIKDQPKPVAEGKVYNAKPVLVNTSLNIYQFNHRSMQAVNKLYDGAAEITLDTSIGGGSGNVSTLSALEATTPAVGMFITCLEEGLVRIETSPEKDITGDIEGDNAGSGYANNVSSLIKKIAKDYVGLTDDDLDLASFTELETANPAEIQFYTDQELPVKDGMSYLLESIGAFMFFSREDLLTVGRFSAPESETPVFSITESDYVEISRELFSNNYEVTPAYRVNLNYKKIFYVQQGADVLESVASDRRAFVEREYRTVQEEDTSVQIVHLEAPEASFDTLLTTESDAEEEASRLLQLYKTRRDRYLVTLFITAVVDDSDNPLILDLNDVVNLRLNRFGLLGSGDELTVDSTLYTADETDTTADETLEESGKNFRIIGYALDAKANKITLDLFG